MRNQLQRREHSKQSQFLNYIGGQWVAAKSGKTFESRNPADPSETWSGRGKTPRWLSKLLTSGKKLDDFLIAASAA